MNQISISDVPPPVVNVSASSPVVLEGDTVQLTATGALTYLWSPSTGLSCTACPSPLATPPQTITYQVTGTDGNGCSTTRSITIDVDILCAELFVPSIFSPNGHGPGKNEQLCVLNDCIAEMDFGVYNRWGQLVFETKDPQQCWDGTKDGKEVSTGVYTFRLYAKLLNGVTVRKAGNVTLTR